MPLPIIQVENLSKLYQVGAVRSKCLKEASDRIWNRFSDKKQSSLPAKQNQTIYEFDASQKGLAHWEELALHHRSLYVNAEPFPHIVIDSILQPVILEQVLREFPQPGQKINWIHYDRVREKDKFESKEAHELGVTTQFLTNYLNS